MQPIPDDRAEKTKKVPNHASNRDERGGSEQIERFDEVNRLDHVCPENEIADRLGPAELQ